MLFSSAKYRNIFIIKIHTKKCNANKKYIFISTMKYRRKNKIYAVKRVFITNEAKANKSRKK